MATPDPWAIPRSSTVLVTGANGFIGSHIADQFLEHGFSVRGTVRAIPKNQWLVDVFQKKYGEGRFELCEVSDMSLPGAFDDAMKGVSAVAHSASIMTLDHNPHKVIPNAVAFAVNALQAAYATPSAKRFVFCSSSTAAVLSVVDRPGIRVDAGTWNEDAVKEAWADPPYTPDRAHAVYSASKTLAEQAVWRYYEEHVAARPDFVVNTVLPNMTLGRCLHPLDQEYPSTAAMVPLLYKGNVVDYHRAVPRQYFVDVQDIGRLHVAAAILAKVSGQRIFGFAGRYNWDAILSILRQLEPDRASSFPVDFSGGADPNEITPRPEAEQLLRDLGRPGWTSLHESVCNNIEGLRLSGTSVSTSDSAGAHDRTD